MVSPTFHNNTLTTGKNAINKHGTNGGNHDKGPIIDILDKADVDITPELLQDLPTWTDVTSNYGNEPIIEGLDTCATFQSAIPLTDRLIGVAGLENTGTNLLHNVLRSFCAIPGKYERFKDIEYYKREFWKTGMMSQVPWGKHKPLDLRGEITNESYFKNIRADQVLPVVIIKHPFSWMSSMCRHPYQLKWAHNNKHHCPNLIPNHHDLNIKNNLDPTIPIPINVKLATNNHYDSWHETRRYDSLTEMWNEWYGQYYSDPLPRLIIRFEDLLFHTESVITQVCKCAGGELKKDVGPIHLQEQPVKTGSGHKSYSRSDRGVSGLITVLGEYGRPFNVKDSTMTMDDVEYANDSLRNDLVSNFGYKLPKVNEANTFNDYGESNISV